MMNSANGQADDSKKVDFDDIIKKLSAKNAEQISKMAILEAKYDKLLSLYEDMKYAYEKQAEVIEGYEKKEAIRSGNADGSDT